MKTTIYLFTVFLLIGFCSCGESHFISNENERNQILSDFEKKKKELPDGDLFNVFNQDLPVKEKEALTFLYAYMPVSDIADYDGEFYKRNVQSAFRAQQEMPWGSRIPEREFRHFVLPIRVNNENMDDSRQVFYAELKDRIKSMNMYDAVLEVNHWCHEKVIYMPSDARTSSPLASVRTAYGRCGEESVFLVAALRSVGIPARQVYTPRWAHTDSNHAWVEAWVDGEWYFLGACEPEPVLNLGWFNAPASRGMLMHTKVFGSYNGPEEVMNTTPYYTEINVIDNYASSSKAKIKVVDAANNPVKDARVDFKIYNYGEFYTVVSRQTDENGMSSLTAGKGDMLVWASKDGKFGYSKLPFGKDADITITLDKKEGEEYAITMDITPPDESADIVKVTPEQRAENDRRMVYEDSIRNSYVATFIDEAKAKTIVAKFVPDTAGLANILIASRGNHGEIVSFLENSPKDKRAQALTLLKVIAEKDLRDTPASVLSDHLMNTPQSNSALYDKYTLNPRVGYEMLTSYKSYFAKELDKDFAEQIKQDPMKWIEWCRNNITIRNDLNNPTCPISPSGVWRSRVADITSRNIFFVSVLRSLGVASRVDPVTGKIQYADSSDKWIDVNFEELRTEVAPKGKLQLQYTPVRSLMNPKYYSQFTLARYTDGEFKTLRFGRSDNSTWEGLFKNPNELDAGYYMLVTGTRMAKGGVLNNITFFNVSPGKTATVQLAMRDNPDEVKVVGNIDSEATFLPKGSAEKQSILQTSGRGYFVVAILGPGQEPTNHALRDIAALNKDFEQWGRSMVFLFTDEQKMNGFNPADFPGLPNTITYGVDVDGSILNMIKESNELTNMTLPVFAIGDTFNRAVFISQGYTIGLGEQLMKVIHKL